MDNKDIANDLLEEDKQEEIIDEEQQEAIISREEFEKSLSNIWGYSNKGIEAKKAAMSMLSTKTGMYSRIPLMCKAEGCPYSSTCTLLGYNLAPYGEPCPVETSQIEIRLKGYEEDFDIKNASFTDKVLITDLINHDILLERCKALLNKDGILVEDVFAGVSEDGEVFYRPEVSKNWEIYERVQKKRNEIYSLMKATRKDKKDVVDDSNSVSKILDNIISGEINFVEEEVPEKFKKGDVYNE